MTARKPRWEMVAEMLEIGGWDIELTRVWRARARRGGHVEEGVGSTREEAFEQLRQLTSLDDCEGCP
jgi:hypothetical protein